MHVDLEKNIIGGEEAEFRFSNTSAPAMNFHLNGAERLRLMPLSFGEFDESSGFISTLKLHEAQDEASWSADTKSVIPFGPEPSVSRTVEIFSNCALVTTDISTTKGISCPEFSVDSLFLPGTWKKVGIIRVSGSDCHIKDITWTELDKAATVYEDTVPFLVAIFESESGERLEIGTGDDIWRWTSAERLGGTSSFEIKYSPEGLHIKRNVLQLADPSTFPARNWRFKWYFAWDSGKKLQQTAENENVEPAFDARKSKWPDPAKIVFDGNIRKEVCFCAHISQKRFKKIIRAASDQNGGNTVKFVNIEPHLCEENSHTGKVNMEKTLHWDMMKILDLRLWAEKQLRKTGSTLRLELPEDSIFKSMPSFS